MSKQTKAREKSAQTKGKGKTKKETESDAADGAEEEEEDDDAQWWSTGYDEMERIPDNDSNRFRQEPRESRMILFIDGDRDEDKERWGTKIGAPFCLWEYEVPTNHRSYSSSRLG